MQAQKKQQFTGQTSKTFDQLFDKIWDSFKDIYELYGIQYTQQSKSTIKSYLNKDSFNYALGAMYGAFLGDALGSYLQFKHSISDAALDNAMKLPGGGTFEFLKPGQFTDDSQLASHLLTALVKFDPSKNLKQQRQFLAINIAEQYKIWLYSDPFDIGITTRVALAQIENLFKYGFNHKSQQVKYLFGHQFDDKFKKPISEFYSHLEATFKTIANKNQKSQSNGSLMRITPIAFLVSTLMHNSKNESEKCFSYYEDFIQDEINMTHGHQAIYQSSKSWVDLLVQIILRKEKSVGEVYAKFEQKYKQNGQRNYKHVQEWIRDSKQQAMDAVNSMGWAKIAYTHGLRQLRKLIDLEKSQKDFIKPDIFKQILRNILSLCGDTDTNGAIIGGLIGAIFGFKNLPFQYLQKQFELRLTLKQDRLNSRGTQYEPRRQFLKAISLIRKFQT